jgi:hypothetical protein
MSEVTEYVANALLRVNRPSGVSIKTYFYQKESLANIQFTVQIRPGEILPDWVHGDEIKALRPRADCTAGLFGVVTKQNVEVAITIRSRRSEGFWHSGKPIGTNPATVDPAPAAT